MATLMYCPKCKTVRECTKKGKNKKTGEQLYWCKTCKKIFLESEGKIPEVKKTKTQKKAEPAKKITKIYVNNTLIKQVDKDLSVNDAFEIIVTYFKDLSKDNVKVEESNNEKKISFIIKIIGTKG